MKNSSDLGGCYPPRPSASEDNTLLDLQNSSYPTGNLMYLPFILSHFDHTLIFCSRQGQQEIRFLVIVATPFQPKIRIMTAGAVTVLCPTKEPGGTPTAIVPT